MVLTARERNRDARCVKLGHAYVVPWSPPFRCLPDPRLDPYRHGAPLAARAVLNATVAVFCYGTIVHLAQLIGSGFDPYPLAPGWLAAYFVSLTLLDPLAAVLLLQRRRAGLILGCAVLLTDAGANAYANYVLDPRPGITAGRVGQAVITLLALALCAAAPRLWPWLRRSES